MRRLTKRSTLSALILLLGGIAGCVQTPPISNADTQYDALRVRIDRAVPRLMGRYQVPGVAIAVVDADGPVYLAGYG